MDLAQAALRVALGHDLSEADFNRVPLAHASSFNFCPAWQGPGRLTRQTFDQAILQDPAFVDHELYFSERTELKLAPENVPNMGWLVARGPTADEAEQSLVRLSTSFKFEFERL